MYVSSRLCLPVLSVLVLTIPGAHGSALQQQGTSTEHLEPCLAVAAAPTQLLRYAIMEGEVLELQKSKRELGRLVGRVLVEPSFEREWVLSLYMSAGDSATVELRVADEPIWPIVQQDAPHHNVSVKRHRASIDNEAAQLVEEVWQAELARTATYDWGPCMDGSRYTFTAPRLTCGSINCTTAGSRMETLKQLSLALRDYAEAAGTDSPSGTAEIVKFATSLLSARPRDDTPESDQGN